VRFVSFWRRAVHSAPPGGLIASQPPSAAGGAFRDDLPRALPLRPGLRLHLQHVGDESRVSRPERQFAPQSW